MQTKLVNRSVEYKVFIYDMKGTAFFNAGFHFRSDAVGYAELMSKSRNDVIFFVYDVYNSKVVDVFSMGELIDVKLLPELLD